MSEVMRRMALGASYDNAVQSTFKEEGGQVRTMEKAGWIIKVTVLTGDRAGHEYYMRKGGYIANGGEEWPEWCYKTKGYARRECRRLKEDNDLSYRIERQDQAMKVKMGIRKEDFFLYELESYEPYEVKLLEMHTLDWFE